MQDGIAPTILVVDSGATQLASVLDTLRRAGYRVSGLESFPDAARLLASVHPDLLMADVRLGAFNGLQLVLQRHAARPTEPSIVTNAYADSVLERQARELGAPYLVKPISPDVLLRTVEALLPPLLGPVASRIGPGVASGARHFRRRTRGRWATSGRG